MRILVTILSIIVLWIVLGIASIALSGSYNTPDVVECGIISVVVGVVGFIYSKRISKKNSQKV